MDGTIINYDRDGQTGVIRAEDKKRYKFSITDWGSGGEPCQGDLIDFEPAEDFATEIFVTKKAPITGATAATAITGLAGHIKQQVNENRASAAQGENPIQNFLMQRPAMIASVLIMIASILPWVTVPPLPFGGESSFQGGGVNLYSAISWASMGIGGLAAFAPASVTVPLRLIYLLYTIPMAGAYLFYREYLGTSDAKLRTRTGILATIGPVGIPLCAALLALIFSGGADNLGGMMGGIGRGANAISGFFGFGLMLTMACGIALIAVAKGWNAIKALVGSFIYLFLLALATDYGFFAVLVVGVGGAVLLIAALKGWNPFSAGLAVQEQGGAENVQPMAAAVPMLESETTSASAPPVEGTKYCSSCGTSNVVGDRFCAECGGGL